MKLTLHNCLLTALLIFAGNGLLAQQGKSQYLDLLLALSEPEAGLENRYEDALASSEVSADLAKYFLAKSHPLPASFGTASPNTNDLAQLIQLATAHRLRGEYADAAPIYERILQLSENPIHHYFYAKTLRAGGDNILAAKHMEIYEAANQTVARD